MYKPAIGETLITAHIGDAMMKEWRDMSTQGKEAMARQMELMAKLARLENPALEEAVREDGSRSGNMLTLQLTGEKAKRLIRQLPVTLRQEFVTVSRGIKKVEALRTLFWCNCEEQWIPGEDWNLGVREYEEGGAPRMALVHRDEERPKAQEESEGLMGLLGGRVGKHLQGET